MVEELEYKLCNQSVGEDNSDAVIKLNTGQILPILTLTDSFIDTHKVSSETVTIGSTNNKLYKKDKDDNDILTYVLTYTSFNKVKNTLYYDNVNECIVNAVFVDDYETSITKNKRFNNKVSLYTNSISVNESDYHIFAINKSDITKGMPLAKDLSGVDVDVIKLDITGLSLPSKIKGVRDSNGFSQDLNILECLAINTSDIGWDTLSPTLYTLIGHDRYFRLLKYVGIVSVSKVYIPLV